MKRSVITVIAALAWLAAGLGGTWAMVAYSGAPGDKGAPPSLWPAESQLPHSTNLPTLLVFLHPHCPCSRASMGELALLMAHCVGRFEAKVVFVDPVGADPTWVKTDLWNTATAIPGLEVISDAGGREAQIFQAATSGDALLYDAAGALLFHGGITFARGHSGDNPGRSMIEALLRGEAAPGADTLVFGCGLFSKARQGKP